MFWDKNTSSQNSDRIQKLHFLILLGSILVGRALTVLVWF